GGRRARALCRAARMDGHSGPSRRGPAAHARRAGQAMAMNDVKEDRKMPSGEREFRLTVGPVLTYWARTELMHFHARVADSAPASVVLGEVVCSRRHEMKADDWIDLARDLRTAGKEPILASLALVESESDLRLLRRLADDEEFLVEAGDASALQ